MCNSVHALLLFVVIVGSVIAAPNQFVARYFAGGSTNLLAVDASGNFFIVGTVMEPSGRLQIRATKTDSQGNFVASFDLEAVQPLFDLCSAVDFQKVCLSRNAMSSRLNSSGFSSIRK
jgi:hypothetical protein